jgi:hypothetical protein
MIAVNVMLLDDSGLAVKGGIANVPVDVPKLPAGIFSGNEPGLRKLEHVY